jgi:UDP-N-acetylglucosamine:LPS N-acetylglucosamine transferase
LDGEKLARAIFSVLDDAEGMDSMSQSARGMGRPNASREIAKRLVDLAIRKGRLSKLATALVELCSVR